MEIYKYQVVIETKLGNAYLDYESDHILTSEECRELLKENIEDKFSVWMRREDKPCKLSHCYEIIRIDDFWKFHCKMEKCSRFFQAGSEVYLGLEKIEINNMHLCPYHQPIHFLPCFKNGDDLSSLPKYPEAIKDLNKIMKCQKYRSFGEIYNKNAICHCSVCK